MDALATNQAKILDSQGSSATKSIESTLPVGKTISATIVQISVDQARPNVHKLTLELNNVQLQISVKFNDKPPPQGSSVTLQRLENGNIQITIDSDQPRVTKANNQTDKALLTSQKATNSITDPSNTPGKVILKAPVVINASGTALLNIQRALPQGQSVTAQIILPNQQPPTTNPLLATTNTPVTNPALMDPGKNLLASAPVTLASNPSSAATLQNHPIDASLKSLLAGPTTQQNSSQASANNTSGQQSSPLNRPLLPPINGAIQRPLPPITPQQTAVAPLPVTPSAPAPAPAPTTIAQSNAAVAIAGQTTPASPVPPVTNIATNAAATSQTTLSPTQSPALTVASNPTATANTASTASPAAVPPIMPGGSTLASAGNTVASQNTAAGALPPQSNPTQPASTQPNATIPTQTQPSTSTLNNLPASTPATATAAPAPSASSQPSTAIPTQAQPSTPAVNNLPTSSPASATPAPVIPNPLAQTQATGTGPAQLSVAIPNPVNVLNTTPTTTAQATHKPNITSQVSPQQGLLSQPLNQNQAPKNLQLQSLATPSVSLKISVAGQVVSLQAPANLPPMHNLQITRTEGVRANISWQQPSQVNTPTINNFSLSPSQAQLVEVSLKQALPQQLPIAEGINQLVAQTQQIANNSATNPPVDKIALSIMQLFGVKPGAFNASDSVKRNVQQGGMFSENKLLSQPGALAGDMKNFLAKLNHLAKQLPTEQKEMLQSTTERMLARITSNQLTHVQQQHTKADISNERSFQIDIPVQHNEQLDNVAIEIKQRKHLDDEGEFISIWSVKLHFDLEARGEVDVEVALNPMDNSISTTFLCTQLNTVRELNRKMDGFRQQLAQQGFEIQTLHCTQGSQVAAANNPISKRIIDIST